MRTTYALVFIGVLASACATRPDPREQWIGKTQHDVIVAMGPPASRESDGADGVILVYEYVEDRGVKPGEVTTDYFGTTKTTPPQERKRIHRTMFYARADGTIYAWKGDTQHIGPP